ncbi:hypothetical protein KFZ56_01525 [Virgibacillus sp. NKC19-3]|uniref:hypothetical protein n=1 Tax=Virgibacillus saliphilus TaxID=2831674 RepID=UPI001C9B93EC|nr:hypothetical protein [Virgibacillus sp. NKC19-3]MBY7141794.1 hypothetical protein [Virgibacillus sp. NKC19-3]
MENLKIGAVHIDTNKHIKCICLNYDQFVSDSNKLTNPRHDGFGINPKERFASRVDKILHEILHGVRTLPDRFYIRLENRYSICNCRIDYVFEVMEKDFLKENIQGSEIPEQTLKYCLDSDNDIVMLYIGMNK